MDKTIPPLEPPCFRNNCKYWRRGTGFCTYPDQILQDFSCYSPERPSVRDYIIMDFDSPGNVDINHYMESIRKQMKRWSEFMEDLTSWVEKNLK